MALGVVNMIGTAFHGLLEPALRHELKGTGLWAAIDRGRRYLSCGSRYFSCAGSRKSQELHILFSTHPPPLDVV